MKKTTAPIKFDSDDTEGSDLSYESSFDEKEDNQGASSSLFKIIMKTNLANVIIILYLLMMPIRGAKEHQLVQGADGTLHANSP